MTAHDPPRRAWKIQVRVAGDEAWRDWIVSMNERGDLCRAFFGTREQAVMLSPKADKNGIAEARVIECVPPRPVAECSCLMVWDESPVFKGGQGRNAAEVEQDGNGCFGLVVGALVAAFALFVVWLIYESVREAPPRHPPFLELPDDPAGRGR